MATTEPTFAHLHVHSGYSLVDGLMNTADLATHAPGRGISAMALTDYGNLFGFIGFYKAMEKAGIKPICGLEIPLQTAAGDFADIVLLVRNLPGYQNLLKLVSRAYTEADFRGKPQLQRDWLAGHVEGLSALSCGPRGEVGRQILEKGTKAAHESLQRLRELFDGEFYLEVSRSGRPQEEDCLSATVELAAAANCPAVAGNDVRFLDPEHFDTHEARVCIAGGDILRDPRRPRLYNSGQYLASAQQMAELFADLPEAVDNANKLAQRCNLQLEFGRMHMPSSQLPEGRTEAEWIREKAFDGLCQRLKTKKPAAQYRKRLEYELEVIERMGFSSYFLVVSEFVIWARENGVTVGPGRGSGAGALVSWVLSITDLDPLQHGLLFERFLNPERVSPPDLDIDFDPVGRNKVIEHVVQMYGREAVAQIATLDFAHAKASIRDAGRVLGYPPILPHRICSLFPPDPQTLTVAEAERALPQLQEMAEADDVREILDLAQQLEGIPRNASRHAGGVVIAPSDLTNYAPLFRSAGDTWVATQYDKKDLESIGLVKFDFLGLTTLSIIDDALAMINQRRQQAGEGALQKEDMEPTDPLPYRLLTEGKTQALFQLAAPRMRTLIQRFAPADFNDIVALLALIRPGPLEAGMFDQVVSCRRGEAELKPPHPLLMEVVRDTWGVMLYQEQVMEAARRLADYSYGEADELRRAMGTKDREEMARHQSIFIERAEAKDIKRKDAQKVFDQMEKFAGYGFNKSHSAAYAVISFQTAWLKAHYPACFMAATLTQECKNTQRDRRWGLLTACNDLNLRVVPPDVNSSLSSFSVEADDRVLFGLSAINGLGELSAQAIVDAREQGGAFRDMYDLCLRAGLHRWDVRVLETLNDAGALSKLEPNQAVAEGLLEQARMYAEQRTQERQQGQSGLFGDTQGADVQPESAAPPTPGSCEMQRRPSWSCVETSQREKKALGLFLKHHPVSYWRRELADICRQRIADLADAEGTIGLAVRVRSQKEVRRKSSTANLAMLDDEFGSCEVEISRSLWQEKAELFDSDALLWVEVEVRPPSGSRSRPYMRLLDAMPLADIRRKRAKHLVVQLEEDIPAGHWDEIKQHASQKGCSVLLRCAVEGVQGDILLPEDMAQNPDEESLERFRQLFGISRVWFEYNI